MDPEVPPEEVVFAFQKLKKEGKIISYGLSECTSEYLERANRVEHVAAIQNRYSMMARSCESLFPLLETIGTSLVAFSPLANGFLSSGAHSFESSSRNDYRSFMPQFTREGYARGKDLLTLLEELAEEKGSSVSSITLRWMLKNVHTLFQFLVPGGKKEYSRMR